jgi:hypothetical protein
MCKEPVPHILARPSHSDIREWHYVLEGSEGTPFEGLLHSVFDPLLLCAVTSSSTCLFQQQTLIVWL